MMPEEQPNTVKWILLTDQKPTEGQWLYFKHKEDSDEAAVLGTWEMRRQCMLGPRNGSFGEGFQDAYNKLASGGDMWIPEEDFPQNILIVKK